MQAARTVCVVLFIGCAALRGISQEDNSAPGSVPPVLRNQDPEANVIVRLPGPAPAPIAIAVRTAQPDTPPPPSEDPPRPLLRHIYPPSFEQDSAAFCHDMIGQWTESDARFLLGEPARQRPAFDDQGVRNGTIFAFTDPTNRYREIELDFESSGGSLRTVFVYPFQLTWEEARRKWGTRVNETAANNGRRFYSYFDRRLDVLVDRKGRVISFGLY
jgi:hypothetical protein